MNETSRQILETSAVSADAWKLLGVRGVILLLGVVATTWLGGIVIAKVIKPYLDELESTPHGKQFLQRGLRDGGKVIGILERFLIYLFVLSNQWSGIGFLIAAKSIFRFGELNDQQNRKEAEYITIGTLMSFSWGLTLSILTRIIANIISH